MGNELKEFYKIQAEQYTEQVKSAMCNMLSTHLSGKQMLELQNILKDSCDMSVFCEFMADFVTKDANLTESDIKVVIKYLSSDVGKRMIESGFNMQKYILDNQEYITSLIFNEEVMTKLGDIIDSK